MDNIRLLIGKFMDGTSTLDEERMLAGYFRTEKQIPADLEPYREMFAYFDGGMADITPAVKKHLPTVSMWRRACRVAAALLALLGMAYWLMPGGGTPQDSMRPTAMVTTPHTPDSVVAQPDSTDREPVRPEVKQERHRQTGKYRFKPAPPETLVAEADGSGIADSVNVAARQLVDIELMKVEYEQQYMQNLIKAANILKSAQMALADDDEDVY